MAKHLTDFEKKKIIADYAECENYSQVARKYKVSVDTVKRTVLRDPTTTEKTKQKKEQNTADILAYMDGKKQDVCDIIELYLEYLKDTKKLERASIQSIATSLGIVIDKFTANNQNDQAIQKLDEMLDKIGGVI